MSALKRTKSDLTDSAKKRRKTLDFNGDPSSLPTTDDIRLRRLLDFSSLNQTPHISDRFDQIANALLHDFHLILRRGDIETVFEILELEFYLQKVGCHEDPFTHGSSEQKISGTWYFHRAPRRSPDSHCSLTSLAGYRGGSRKGLDLTIGGPGAVASPYFASTPDNAGNSQPLPLGGVLLRTLRRASDSKLISGPSLLVDQILLLSKAANISDLVGNKWARDTSAFQPTSSPTSLYLKPVATSAPHKTKVYRSPRIGLDLSHPGTTPSTAHPRVVFLPKPYRYFVHPELLTSNGRTQTFLGVLRTCLGTGQHGTTTNRAALRQDLARITGLRESTVTSYLAAYQAGIDGGSLQSFVGRLGKGASASPSTYLRMMGTLEKAKLNVDHVSDLGF